MRLTRPVATNGAESWALNKYNANQLATLERKVLRRMLRVNENWRQQYNKEQMQLFGDLNILSFVRISWLNWIGHVSRMDSHLFKDNSQGRWLKRIKKTDGGNVYKQILIDAKLKMERDKKQVTGRTP